MDRSLTAALLRPRHLLVTFAVAILTGALGLTVAASDGPTAAPDGAALEQPFSIPVPRAGDHGRYVHAGGHDTREDGYWPDSIEFAWLADGTAYNATGSRVLVNNLVVNQTGSGEQHYSLWPGSTLQVGHAAQHDSESSDPGLFPFIAGSTTNDRIRSVSFIDRDSSLWCGIRNPLQGKTVDLGEALVDRTTCWNGPGSWNVPGFVVVAVQAAGSAPDRTVVFEGRMVDQGRIEEQAFLRATYREGVAYPIRLEYLSGDAGDTFAAAYVLDALQDGTAPIAMQGQVLAPAPAPVELAPAQEFGPDETGVEHRFPLSAAFELAKTNPDPDYATYRLAHPDAYLGLASYFEHSQDVRYYRDWYLVFSDGEQQFGVVVQQVAVATPAPSPETVGYQFQRLDGWEEGTYPAPGSFPAHFPTVASTMRTWQELTASDQPANSWGFDLRCMSGADDACDPSRWTMAAGRRVDDFVGTLSLGGHRAINESQLAVYLDGRLASHMTRVTTQEFDPVAPLTSGSAPGSGDDGPQLAALGGTSWIPSAGEAVAIGGFAALATLVYWVWPALKTGFVGLFSRVEPEELLENPTRAMLVAAVEANPGIHHQELVRIARKGNGAAEHHLQKLVDGGLLTRHRSAGYTCYFRSGKVDRRAMASAHLLKSPVARAIVEAAQASPGSGLSQVAKASGVSVPTVHYHVQRLRQAGLVRWDDGLYPGAPMQGPPPVEQP